MHYDNDGADVGEGVEVVLPTSADPARFDLYFYNGNDGETYAPSQNVREDFIAGETVGDFKVYSLAFDPIQNGAPDGLALAKNRVLIPGQFLSYEGVFTAVGGPADDETSIDIGVAEGSTTPVGFSLQLTGTGASYEDFAWQLPATDSFGSVNKGQAFVMPTTTLIQLIHNSADPSFTVVDIYVNGTLFEDDIAFRTGTPFFDVPAGEVLEVAVAPGDSDDISDTVFAANYTFDSQTIYHYELRGVGEGNFEPNPNGGNIRLTLRSYPEARTASSTEDMVDLDFVNSLTDAPSLDVRLGARLLFNNVSYGPNRPYQAVAAELLTLEVATADGSMSLGLFEVDLTGREGEAGTIRASGFLTPENEDDTNGEPPSFGLLVVFADGSELFAEPLPVANEDDALLPRALTLGTPYPNPVWARAAVPVTVPLTLSSASTTDARLALYDLLGREIVVLHNGPLVAGEHPISFDPALLPSGVYFIRATVNGQHLTERLTVLR